jgi:non-specific protein-tyrosine kinase
MGKFSEALKKAEKENASRPAPERAIQEEAVPPSDFIKPDRTVDQRRMARRQQQKMFAVERSKDAQQLQPPVPQPVTKANISEVEPPLDPVETNQSGKKSSNRTESPEMALPNPPGQSTSQTEMHQDNGSDGLNILLVKPEVTEPPRPVQEQAWKQESAHSDRQPIVNDRSNSGKKVRFNYSKTKVQINDPEILRNNKIFSVFDDMETTDQIKILRTQVLRKLKAIGGNSILVTSANPYEGKTFTSINLGVSIAKEFDRTVLIIDADIRKPTQKHTSFSTEFFSLKVEYGLTDYLEGDADISDILINPGIDKLTLIPGGVPVDNSPELLNSGRMEEMMLEIKTRYPSDRIVIVDGPAILPFSDAMILSRYVDGVVPVIESEKTSSEDLKKMMLHLKEVNVLGVVLNKNKG